MKSLRKTQKKAVWNTNWKQLNGKTYTTPKEGNERQPPDKFKKKHLNKLSNTLIKDGEKISTEKPVSQPDPFL